MKKTKEAIPSIQPLIFSIGAGHLQMRYQGAPFLEGILELIKNARDWGATVIQLITSDSRQIICADNGQGMNGANRNAFCSVNKTTARGRRQAGKFCSGTKMLFFAYATEVSVVTFPNEESERGYSFRFTREEYEQLAVTQGQKIPELITRSSTKWPYTFRFGTAVTYTFEDPSRRSILRGKKLAALLAARLPVKFRSIVQVDGEWLSEKDIITDYYQTFIADEPQLGRVDFELYRAKNPTSQDKLWLAGVEVGEVPIDNLYSALDDDLRSFFPLEFLLTGMAGTITCEIIKGYTNEDRKSLNPRISEDPAILSLIKLMRTHLPAILECLQIKTRLRKDPKGEEKEIEILRDRFNSCYDPEGKGPPSDKLTRPSPPSSLSIPPIVDKTGPALTLLGFRREREYELGETISLQVQIRSDLGQEFGPEDIQWHHEKTGCDQVVANKNTIQMKANQSGEWEISADIPGTAYSAIGRYRIVNERVFRLSPSLVKVQVGETAAIQAVNLDKLRGEISWSLEGPGEFRVRDDKSVIYQASEDEGFATLTAFDSAGFATNTSCEIHIVPPQPKNAILIRKHWFLYDIQDLDTMSRPAIMIRGGTFHQLLFNRRVPGWEEAKATGNLPEFLGLAASLLYPGFCRFVLEEEEEESTYNRKGLEELYPRLVDEGYQIFWETFKDKNHQKE